MLQKLWKHEGKKKEYCLYENWYETWENLKWVTEEIDNKWAVETGTEKLEGNCDPQVGGIILHIDGFESIFRFSSCHKEQEMGNCSRRVIDVVHVRRKTQAYKKEWNNAICSNMDGPGDYHTKLSQTEKDKYHMISLIWAM